MENEYKDALEDMVWQFAYNGKKNGRLTIHSGGLSALERAFSVLGWEDPKFVPESECEVQGCHEYANCGMTAETTGDPTGAYRRICGDHYQKCPIPDAKYKTKSN